MSDSVLAVLPGFSFGGAERVAADILSYLKDRGSAVAAVGLMRRGIRGTDSAAAWFAPAGPVHRIDRGREASRQLSQLIAARDVSALVLCGRSPAYGLLPQLLAAHPHLRVTSFQFNAVQTIRENRQFAPYIDALVAESFDAAQALTADDAAHLPVSIISSGVPARALAARLRPPSGERLTIGYVGRFDRSKNPRAFLRLAHRLARTDFRFVMAGPVPSRFRPPRGVRHAGLLLGEDLQQFIDAIDILVVPSRNDGRPLIIQEAQARGIAVVASAIGGIPELVADGTTGLLCEVDDDAGFAAALLRLAADPALRQRLGEAGRKRVLRDGDIAAALPRYAEAITGRAFAA